MRQEQPEPISQKYQLHFITDKNIRQIGGVDTVEELVRKIDYLSEFLQSIEGAPKLHTYIHSYRRTLLIYSTDKMESRAQVNKWCPFQNIGTIAFFVPESKDGTM
jgi:hypothetical protein